MSDSEKIESRYHIMFVHGVLADFYKQVLDYFSKYLYPRFDWTVVNVFDKAVEYINKTDKYGRKTDQPMLPALTIIPSGDFVIDDPYGKMLWRFPNLSPGLIKRLSRPIYQDENVLVNIGFSRFRGELELLALLGSFYEYMDLKVYLNLIFGGTERYIYPFVLNSHVILPTEVYDYRYSNEYTGNEYKIDIPTIINKLIKTTNSEEVVYPFDITPRFKLLGTSDVSTRLGGSDRLPDWRLTFTLEYMIEIPTFIIIENDYLAKYFNLNIKYGSYYTVNNDDKENEQVPIDVMEHKYMIDWNMSDSTSSTIVYPSETEEIGKYTKELNTRYYHIVTSYEADSTADIDILLPEEILTEDLLLLYYKDGPMQYMVQYQIDNSLNDGSSTIVIIKENVSLVENDVIELYVYKYKT